MNKKCILFLRVSTTSQIWEQQVESVKKLALDDGFKDDDIIIIGKQESAIKLAEEERESIQELKSWIEQGVIDCVYIFEISRIARRMDVLYKVRDMLVQNRVQLKCVEPHFVLLKDDRSDVRDDSNLILALLGAVAEQEMKIKKARFAKARQLKADKGEFFGGSVILGYKVEGKGGKIVVDKEGAALVRRVFDLYEGGRSQIEIAREMQLEFPEKKFMLSVITRILNNELYTGMERPPLQEMKDKDGNVYRTYKYKRQYPPIISREQFDRCRKIADENRNHRKSSKHIYYTHRLIKCPICGTRWGVCASANKYLCRNAYNLYDDVNKLGPFKCEFKHSISINLMDSFIWHISCILEAKFIVQDIQKTKVKYQKQIGEYQKRIDSYKKNVDNIETKIDKVLDLYLDERISEEKHDEKSRALTFEKNNLLAKILDDQHHIDNLQRLLKSVERNIVEYPNFKTRTLLGTKSFQKVLKEVKKINDDKERYNIVHKHIKQVVINVIDMSFDVKNNGEIKDVKVKQIVIDTYEGKQYTYYYVPFYDKMYTHNPLENPETIEFERFNRFGKEVSNRVKVKRQEKSKQFWSQFEGYYTPKQASEILGVPQIYANRLQEKYGIWMGHIGKFVIYKKEDIEELKVAFESCGRLTSDDVSKQLKVSKKEIWQLVKDGKLKGNKMVFRGVEKMLLYFRQEDIDEYMKCH